MKGFSILVFFVFFNLLFIFISALVFVILVHQIKLNEKKTKFLICYISVKYDLIILFQVRTFYGFNLS